MQLGEVSQVTGGGTADRDLQDARRFAVTSLVSFEPSSLRGAFEVDLRGFAAAYSMPDLTRAPFSCISMNIMLL